MVQTHTIVYEKYLPSQIKYLQLSTNFPKYLKIAISGGSIQQHFIYETEMRKRACQYWPWKVENSVNVHEINRAEEIVLESQLRLDFLFVSCINFKWLHLTSLHFCSLKEEKVEIFISFSQQYHKDYLRQTMLYQIPSTERILKNTDSFLLSPTSTSSFALLQVRPTIMILEF